MEKISHRFPRSTRLTDAASYQAVFKGAQARSTDGMFVVLAGTNSIGAARLGLAITKKKTPTAVARNRLKRIVRESFRHHQEQLRDLDIVVMSQAGADRRSSTELNDALLRHWKKISEQCKRSSSR